MESQILQNLKAALVAAEIARRDKSVFITPHETFIPANTTLPAIGIKDGKSTYTMLAGLGKNIIFQVEFIVWVDVEHTGDEMVAGDDGLLELIGRVVNAVDLKTFSLAAVNSARPVSTTPSRLFVGDNRRWMAKKSVIMEYDIETER